LRQSNTGYADIHPSCPVKFLDETDALTVTLQVNNYMKYFLYLNVVAEMIYLLSSFLFRWFEIFFMFVERKSELLKKPEQLDFLSL